jgi:uncharacterized protein (TIGR02271 family)
VESTGRQWEIPEGTDVVGSDGDKIGKVVAANESYVVVEKGLFFPTDYYVPISSVANFDGDKVYLNVTKDDALNQGWDVIPGDETVGTGTGAFITGATSYDDTTDIPTAEGAPLTDADLRVAGTFTPEDSIAEPVFGSDLAATRDTTEVGSAETLRVPVHEEELTATTRPVEQGQVRIAKDVVAEERTLEVPVTEERVVVERRVVDRDAGADATAFQEGTIEVPVRGEEVDVQKRVRVAEEIEVGKEAVQRTERVAGTVRHEEVRVEDQTNAEVVDAATGTTAVPDSATTRRTM